MRSGHLRQRATVHRRFQGPWSSSRFHFLGNFFFFIYDFCYQVLMEKNRTLYWYSNTGKNVHLFFNVGVNLSCKKTVEDWRRAWINQKGDFDTKLSMGKNWNFDFKQLQLKNMWICCEWRRRWWQRRGWWWNWNFWNWHNKD